MDCKDFLMLKQAEEIILEKIDIISNLTRENEKLNKILTLLKKHIKIKNISENFFVINFVNNAILNPSNDSKLTKELRKIKEWYDSGN